MDFGRGQGEEFGERQIQVEGRELGFRIMTWTFGMKKEREYVWDGDREKDEK